MMYSLTKINQSEWAFTYRMPNAGVTSRPYRSLLRCLWNLWRYHRWNVGDDAPDGTVIYVPLDGATIEMWGAGGGGSGDKLVSAQGIGGRLRS